MLSGNQLAQITTAAHSARPLVFFDDDADGLCSYLLIRNENSDAHGLRAARGPELTHHFIGFVRRIQPDQVLILDKPLVSEQFTQEVTTKTLWLDHHDPSAYTIHKQHNHLNYLNPSVQDPEDHRPTSYWVHQALGGPLWIAAAGVTSDWDTSLLEALRERYPDIAPKTNDIYEALYNSKLGEIIRIINFCLKGSTQQINDCVAQLIHIHTPEELLAGESEAARHIHAHVKPIIAEYKEQLAQAQHGELVDGVYSYIFGEVDTSLVTNVANEMLTKTDADILLIGRNDGDRINFSMRSSHVSLPAILESALASVDGYGGGHEFACGGSIVKEDWERFIESVRKQL